MTHDDELHDLMQEVAEKSLRFLEDFRSNPSAAAELLKKFISLSEQFQALITVLLKNPEKVWDMQVHYWTDAMNLATNHMQQWLEGKPIPINDNRFRDEEWLNNPFYNLMSQQYLLATEHVNQLLETLEYGDKALTKRVRFFTRQYLDALSPANFIHTNPKIIAETIESSGKNLLRGLNNLLTDLESGSSQLMIKMTDTKAFTLGENLATTPGKVIFQNDMMELIQYIPQTSKVKSIPLLIIPPWINKYYVLDLSPKNSLVRYLVEQGITVFVISWVNPNADYAQKSFYDYMKDGPITAIDNIKRQLNVPKVNTLGFCIGGTLQAAMLAYLKAHKDNAINSATFLASMIDFSDPGDIAVFIDEAQINQLEEEMKKKGYLAGAFMATSFNSLRANDLIWSFFIKNYLQGKNPVPFDILFWNADSTNMPAKMHSQYLRWMYLHNDLIKPGKIKLHKTPIDVHQIEVPTFFLSTKKDHIAPWKTTYTGFETMKGPKRFVLGGSGHIAGIINPPESEKYNYFTNSQSNLNADEWLAGAKEHSGSWWPEWLKWLKSHSGKTVMAQDINSLSFKPIMDAPGSYVFGK